MAVAGLEGDGNGLLDLLVRRLPGACHGGLAVSARVRSSLAPGVRRTEAKERELCAVGELEGGDSLNHVWLQGGKQSRSEGGGRGGQRGEGESRRVDAKCEFALSRARLRDAGGG